MQHIHRQIEKYVTHNENIGILMSGGFDSTTLCYLVCKTITELKLDRTITVFTVPRYDDSVLHVQRVLGWIKILFPLVNINLELVGNPDAQHHRQVTTGIREALYKHPKLLLLTGDTTNPPEDVGQPGPVNELSDTSRVVQPFFEYHKTTTVQLAQDMNVLKEISEISHTCTESLTDRCNMCWQCRERAWAFSKLGLVDTGTM